MKLFREKVLRHFLLSLIKKDAPKSLQKAIKTTKRSNKINFIRP